MVLLTLYNAQFHKTSISPSVLARVVWFIRNSKCAFVCTTAFSMFNSHNAQRPRDFIRTKYTCKFINQYSVDEIREKSVANKRGFQRTND